MTSTHTFIYVRSVIITYYYGCLHHQGVTKRQPYSMHAFTCTCVPERLAAELNVTKLE